MTELYTDTIQTINNRNIGYSIDVVPIDDDHSQLTVRFADGTKPWKPKVTAHTTLNKWLVSVRKMREVVANNCNLKTQEDTV